MAEDAKKEKKRLRNLLKGIVDEEMSNGKQRGEALMRKLVEMAYNGNIKAMELVVRMLNEMEDNVTLTINQPRDLTPEEAAALQKHLEEEY